MPGALGDEAAELNRREEVQLAIETATVTLDQVVEANFGRFHGGPSFYGELYPACSRASSSSTGASAAPTSPGTPSRRWC